MAYSKITIVFNSLPNIEDVLYFFENSTSSVFGELFKKQRLALKQVAIPAFNLGLYEISYNEIADTSNIGVAYNDGTYKVVSIDNLESSDSDGIRTARVYSKLSPTIVDLNTQEAIIWGEGSFNFVENSYMGFVSTNYRTSFNLDYNISNFFTVTALPGPIGSGLGSVIIEANYPNAIFEAGPTTADVTFLIENAVTDVLIIQDLNYSEATTNGKCSHYKVNTTTDKLAVKITLNGTVLTSSNTANPYSFEVLRGQAWTAIFEDAAGNTATRITYATDNPIVLNEGVFDFQASYTPSGSSIVILPLVSLSGLVLEYSLDGVTWQTSNVFPGILAGSYTIHVRDQLGCSFIKNLVIDDSGILESYFLMPKSNSIRFANRVTWGDCGNYKNDENTLSCESTAKLPHQEIQRFQSCDVITTQFRSNYAENLVTVIREDETEVNIPVVQATNLMGLKDRRDARKYNLGNNKTGIYFVAGSLYDFDLGTNIGTYALNGQLPQWANIATYIKVDADWFLIEGIFFDININADVVVIADQYTGADVSVQVACIYNLENYEEFEAVIDFVDYIDEKIRVRVNSNDSNFTNIEQISELIDVKVRQYGTLEIRYKNKSNTDMNFSRGLENKIRLLVEKVGSKVLEENNETSKSDTSVTLLSSEVYEMDEFLFSPLTTQMMRKLVLALSHDTVSIDGVPYVKNDDISSEGPLEDTNLYDVTALMIKSANAFNSNSGQGNSVFNQDSMEVPGLIESDSGYVAY